METRRRATPPAIAPPPPRRRTWPAIALALLAISSTTAYAWDQLQGAGDLESARRAAWTGSDKQRRQAVVALHKEAAANIRTLQELALSGHGDDRVHAAALLTHLRQQLGN